MGEATNISWCHSTLNFWVGCTEVSAACNFCYARTMSERYGWAKWGDYPRHRTALSTRHHNPMKWQRTAKQFIEKMSGRRRVFVNSLSDFFDNQVPPDWRADSWALMAECPDLDFLLLTKRPQNIKKMLPASYVEQLVGRDLPPWPWRNVWLGVTAENQEEADRRIPALLKVPATVHFISAEPLLEPIDVSRWMTETGWPHSLDWVITGCESGRNARPFPVDGDRMLRDQCKTAGVAFFEKQRPGTRGKVITDINQFPEDLRIQEFPATA